MNKTTNENGYCTFDEAGQFHSYNDEPAILVENHFVTTDTGEQEEVFGYKAWYKNGKIHRENAPAIIRNTGEEFYYLEGNLQ